jgi:hypothetical protein
VRDSQRAIVRNWHECEVGASTSNVSYTSESRPQPADVIASLSLIRSGADIRGLSRKICAADRKTPDMTV